MAEDSSAFTSFINWEHEEQRGLSHFSLCKDLQGVCTKTHIKFNRSFEDISQAVLFTSWGGEGFPKLSETGLKQGLLELFSAFIGCQSTVQNHSLERRS